MRAKIAGQMVGARVGLIPRPRGRVWSGNKAWLGLVPGLNWFGVGSVLHHPVATLCTKGAGQAGPGCEKQTVSLWAE